MDRREALKYTGWIAGTGLLAPGVFAALQSCRNSSEGVSWEPQVLTDEQVNQLTFLADTILPATETPSASEVRVPEFIDLLMTDVLSEDQNQSITDGLRKLNGSGKDESADYFIDITSDQRQELVKQIDDIAFGEESSGDYTTLFLSNYRYLKAMILMAYYTSKEGVKQNLNYVVTPGDYVGCMDLPQDGKVMVGNHM